MEIITKLKSFCFLLILCSFQYLSAQSPPPIINGTTYYISSSDGNDNDDGLSPGSAWKSLNRVQQQMTSIEPGDAFLFKRGDVFYADDRLNISQSGTAGSPIVLGAYGQGEKPIINGGKVLDEWTKVGENLWQSSCLTCDERATLLTINGSAQPIGRYPNLDEGQGGYLLPTNLVSSNSEITCSVLASAPVSDWTGAELVVRKERWIIDRHRITGQQGTKLLLDPNALQIDNGFYYVINKNGPSGFFIQNHPGTLDRPGEWSFLNQGSKLVFLYSIEDPNLQKIEITGIPILIRIQSKSNIVFDNLKFTNSIEESIVFRDASGITIQNCEFYGTGENAMEGYDSQDIMISDCKADFTNNNVVDIWRSDNVTVRSNTFVNTALNPGMGKSGDFENQGIYVSGQHSLVTKNKLDQVGYNGIRVAGSFATISENWVNESQKIADDGGAIYVYQYHLSPVLEEIVIEKNIVTNTIGTWKGLPKYPHKLAYGIYCDDASHNVTVRDNYIFNSSHGGIYLHNAFKIRVENNLVDGAECSFIAKNDNIADADIREISVSNNIFSGNANEEVGVYLESQKGGNQQNSLADISQFGMIDSNHYVNLYRKSIPNEIRYYFKSEQFALSDWSSEMQYSGNFTTSSLPHFHKYNVIPSSDNLFSNSDVENNENWNIWGNCRFVPSGPIDGGALMISDGGALAQLDNLVQPGVGQDQYVLYVSTMGNVEGGLLKVFLRDGNANSAATDRHHIFVSTELEEHQLVFTLRNDVNTSNLQVLFQTPSGQLDNIWIDNISVYKVGAMLDNNDLHKRIEFNHSDTVKVVPVSGKWVDLQGRAVINNLVLEPYSGTVLVQAEDLVLSLSEDLVEFKVEKGQRYNTDVKWEMKDESERYIYQVEHSIDGLLFQKISNEIPTKALNKTNKYHFQHDKPLPGKNYYRLKQVAPDGTIEYSKVKEILFSAADLSQVEVNYFAQSKTLEIKPHAEIALRYGCISNVQGQTVWEKSGEVLEQSFSVSAENWIPGVYFLRLVDDHDVLQASFKFIVTP